MRRFDHVTLAAPERLDDGPRRCVPFEVVQQGAATGWARGARFDDADEPVIFETHDGGRSWTELPGLCPGSRGARWAMVVAVVLGSSPFAVLPLLRLLVPGLHAPSPADPWLAQGLVALGLVLLVLLVAVIRRRRALGVWPTDVERLLPHASPGHVVAVVRTVARTPTGEALHELLWDGWRWRYLRPHVRPARSFDEEPVET